MKILLIIATFFLFNSNGFSKINELDWSSYYGGNGEDLITASEYDADGNLYVIGFSNSSNFATSTNAHQRQNKGSYDIFITKFDTDMNILWSTLFGGNGREIAQSFDIAEDGIWIVGETLSNNFPVTSNAFQTQSGGGSGEVMIVKFSFSGELLYSTYFGGTGYDYAADIVIDNNNNAWITGRTLSAGLIVTDDAHKSTGSGGYDSYLLKLSAVGDLLYSSYIGGNSDDFGLSIEYSEITDEIYISGFTRSTDLETVGLPLQLQKNGGSQTFDSYLYAFDSEANITWTTYYGGQDNDYPLNLKFDNKGNLLIHYYTTSLDAYTESGSFSTKNAGSVDNYLLMIDPDKQYVWSTYIGGSREEGNDDIFHKFGDLNIDDNDNIYILGFTNSDDIPIGSIPAYDNTVSEDDACLISFSPDGDLRYTTYLGGSIMDEGWSIATTNDKVALSGWTSSPDFPITENAIQKSITGHKDGFISIFALEKSPCESQYSSSNGFSENDLISNKLLGNSSVNLTRKWAYDAGYMYYHNKLNLISGFQTEFSFVISDPSRYFTNPEEKAPQVLGDTSLAGADGIALVLAGEIPIIPALAGGDIGYGGLTNAIAIEIDLYENPENRDPNGNHVSVILPNEDNQIFPLHPKKDTMTTTDVIEIKSDSSQTYHCKVVYENLTLKIYLSDSKEYGKPVLTVEDFLLFNYLNMEYNGNGFLGITSSTGRSVEVHEITEWSICTSRNLILTSVDEVESNEIEFYPSPVSEYMTINLPANLNNGCTIKVYDLLGNLQMQNNISSYKETVSLDANTLAKGAYSVVIESDGNIVGSSKFIKK